LDLQPFAANAAAALAMPFFGIRQGWSLFFLSCGHRYRRIQDLQALELLHRPWKDEIGGSKARLLLEPPTDNPPRYYGYANRTQQAPFVRRGIGT
jgi:hypothetical protein